MPDIERLRNALADHYRLERELGAGGMATVYLAHDVKHHRQVAIKVLRPELAAVIGAERFLGEIRTTAHLQHPHILPLFDSGEADSFLYYVMPYIEGESLRDRLQREKQLPINDAVRIATEVASALDYAHRHGIIHRDIKPENVMLHDGQAMVADFGIALAASSAGSRMTETGMSLGTPHYMSPEQAMGERELTARSDVYALGVMTYEMLTGEPPFTGPTAQSIVAKVMTEQPVPPSRHRATIPEEVEDAILTAIAKLPADRFATAAAFADQLRGSGPAVRPRRTSAQAVPIRRRGMGLLVAGAALVLAAGWAIGRATGGDAATSTVPPARLALLAQNLGGSGAGALYRQLTLSSDGSMLYFVAGGSTGFSGGIAAQPLVSESQTMMQGTELTYDPSVSPDGKWMAVRNGAGDPMLVALDQARRTATPFSRGYIYYDWHPDGTLWFTPEPYNALLRIRPGSDDSAEVMLDSLPGNVWLQQILPDGKGALMIENVMGTAAGPLSRIDLASGERTPLISNAINSARYTDGMLVYGGLDGILHARTLNQRTGELGSTITVIATNVALAGSGDLQFAVSTNGTLAYVPQEPRQLVLVNRDGAERALVVEGQSYHMPRFSRDRTQLSVDFISSEGRDVWLLNLAQGTMTRATFDRDGHDGTWTPEGGALTYASNKSGAYGVYRVLPGSGTPPESLLATNSLTFTGEWLPDGTSLLSVANDLRPGSGQDIALVRNQGRGPIEPLVASRFSENYPAISPDGRWFAFVSDESGSREVYVRGVAANSSQFMVSQGGGEEPMWTPDGRELFYRGTVEGTPTMMVLRMAFQPTPSVTARTTLFAATNYLPTTPHANYDVSGDGNALVMVRVNPASRVMVIQNLRGLVAAATQGEQP